MRAGPREVAVAVESEGNLVLGEFSRVTVYYDMFGFLLPRVMTEATLPTA